jgi:hypothetical protein
MLLVSPYVVGGRDRLVSPRVQQIVDDQIKTIEGLAWYDGLSYEDLGNEESAAYKAVFAELTARGLAAGLTRPIVYHAGNGHYSVCAEAQKPVP